MWVSHLEDPTTDAPETTAMLEKIDAPPAVASSGILGQSRGQAHRRCLDKTEWVVRDARSACVPECVADPLYTPLQLQCAVHLCALWI